MIGEGNVLCTTHRESSGTLENSKNKTEITPQVLLRQALRGVFYSGVISMIKPILIFCLVFLAAAGTGLCQKAPGKSARPVAIIFDTDFGPDYDDVGAIALLHALADSGQANILATIASDKHKNVSPVLNAFNTYFQRPGIPIGVPKGQAVADPDWQHWSDTILARYPHRIKSNAEVPDAVALYREILARQPDKSVTLVTVGFLTNLANLLESPPDQHSRLAGRDLVRKKVKLLVSMAGKFPEGKEFNLHKDAGAAKRALDHWPTPIIFSGFEIGVKIKTGLPLVQDAAIRNSPVKDAYRISIPKAREDKDGRMSWDQTAVLIAIQGAGPYYGLQPGRITMQPDGSNTWDAAKKGHYYLVEKMPVAQVRAYIDKLMRHQPAGSK
jgi:pyrimidine-specific ribonucleoside hydrolase